MSFSYTYTKDASCCPGEDVTISIKRVIIADLSKPPPTGFICGHRANDESIINYKALSKRNGNTRQYSVKRVGLIGARSRLGQSVQAVGSMLTPGNLSRVRSPIRSRLYSAITPGGGRGLGRGIRGRERSYRCPEGYQYGGRFTDSEFSTCGAQLFDLPGILGETIAAIRRTATRGATPARVERGEALTSGRPGAEMTQSRDPKIRAASIPKVGEAQPNLQRQTVSKLIPQMGKPGINAHRMIRRDGFDLEPVVTPAVLRTIPDNRDMEGATYLLTLPTNGMGGEELGLLSNTGVTNLTYVRDDGTSVSIAKVRELTVGERRKLGRTVNAAMKKDDSGDPLARLNFVSEETGDGIRVTEQTASASTRTAPRPTPVTEAPEAPETPETEKISGVDEALAHISQGGNLSDISPSILEEVLREKNAVELAKKLVTTPDKRHYSVRDSKNDFEHLHAAFASDVQRHLGLQTPDIAFVGKGSRRRYLVEDAASVIDGGKVDRRRAIDQASPREMSSMLIADVLTGIDNRLATSLTPVSSDNKSRLIATDNPSELTALDKLEIREATQRRIETMRAVRKDGIYGKYFAALQEEQQKLMRQQLGRLIERAGSFSARDFRQELTRNGELTPAERSHLAIIETIYETRLGLLRNSLQGLLKVLGGTA